MCLNRNTQGVYDSVAFYRSKKAAEPYVTLTGKDIAYNVLDELTDEKGRKIACTRHYKIMDLAEDGSRWMYYIQSGKKPESRLRSNSDFKQ